jgi:hypothetical protein
MASAAVSAPAPAPAPGGYKTSSSNFSFYQGRFQSSHTPIESAVAHVAGFGVLHPLPSVQPAEARLKHRTSNKPLTPEEQKLEEERLQKLLGEGMANARLRIEYLKRQRPSDSASSALSRGGTRLQFSSPEQFLRYEARINSRLTEARVSLMMQQYRATLLKWLKKRNCRRCHYDYSHITSMGKWQCRYHPGTIKDGHYDCCGQYLFPSVLPDRDGCRMCDHTDTEFHRQGIVVYRIPAILMDLLHPNPRAVVVRREIAVLIPDLDPNFVIADQTIANGIIAPILAKADYDSEDALAVQGATASGQGMGGAMTDRELIEAETLNAERREPDPIGWHIQSCHKDTDEDTAVEPAQMRRVSHLLSSLRKDPVLYYYIYTAEY